MSNKTINYLAILFYLSLLAGFFLNEDLNGGAKPDFYSYDKLINSFVYNFQDTLLNYESFNERHSPLMVIIISLFSKANFDFDIIRFINLHINLLSIYFFYQCLKIKFSDVNLNYLILISLIFFLSTTFRSLSIWPDSRGIGLLFIIISIKYFLEYQESKKFDYVLKNIFFLAISSYFSPNFSLFSIYFFFYYLLNIRNFKNILYIVIFNIILAFPAFYYVYILDVNFIQLGATPGSSKVLISESVEFNISNKIISITSIIFFYVFPVFIYTKNVYQKKILTISLSIIFFIIYTVCILNFNYQVSFTGGGIFFLISNYVFQNNYLLYFICLIAFYFFFIKNFNLNNLFIISILIFSNPQLSIYHKYYDPLILVLMFTLFQFNIHKDFFNKLNVSLIYFIYLFFLIAKSFKIFLN